MNAPKSLNNSRVQAIVANYWDAADICRDLPSVDDILSGVLAAKTTGNSRTRPLSRRTLFHILQWCAVIDVAAVREATHGKYAYSTVASYAAAARVASRALERFFAGLPETRLNTGLKESQTTLDASYAFASEQPDKVAGSNF